MECSGTLNCTALCRHYAGKVHGGNRVVVLGRWERNRALTLPCSSPRIKPFKKVRSWPNSSKAEGVTVLIPGTNWLRQLRLGYDTEGGATNFSIPATDVD